MSVSIFSAAIQGIDAQKVDVEVDSSPGIHSLTIVGLPDKAVQESKDRIGSAIRNSGFVAPSSKIKKIIVNLAPADLKKEGPSYDLPIAVGYLFETGQIKFNPKIISYEKLAEIFFHLHDPTTLNRQGNDIGTQYRSAIFYHSAEQNRIANEVRKRIESEHIYGDPIVTEIVPFKNFYRAEDYHKKYYDNNREASYCRVVIDPKIQKLFSEFKSEVKTA